jgi:hypothetical protein
MRPAWSRFAAGIAVLLSVVPAGADDSAASVALGGIQFEHEPRISMEKERLTISQSRVTVEYEFLNESDQDITTEVAFPIPTYEASHAYPTYAFDDFKLWIDGKEVKYLVEARALLGKRDVSAILKRRNIDIPTLGHSLGAKDDCSPDIDRLPRKVGEQLIKAGLFDGSYDAGGCGGLPLWKAQKRYYWKQTFPAHKILRVRHEYTPGFGFEPLDPDLFDEQSRTRLIADLKRSGDPTGLDESIDLLRSACVSPAVQRDIFSRANASRRAYPDGGAYVDASWVDFILTTANNWKTPIKEFELSIERGPIRDHGWYSEDWNHASVCWDGPVKRMGPDHYEASARDFVPQKELRVLFLTVPEPQANPLSARAPAHKARQNWLRLCLIALGAACVLLVTVWFARRRTT